MARTRYGTVTAWGSELPVGSSRFLSQPAFLAYKLALAGYYLFWAIYWPEFEGFSKQAVHQLTFWTWDVCTGYFIVSSLAAFLCWRASGPVLSSLQQGPLAPSSTTNPMAPVPIATPTTTVAVGGGRGGGAKAVVATIVGKPPVPWGLRWLQLLLWNVACVASLIVTLVWATGDYLVQVQERVKNFDYQAHGLVAFFMLVDQLLVADDFKLKHLIISQVYGVIYLTFSIFWFYHAPEEDKYLYEDTLDWESNRMWACIWGGVAIGILVPLAALVHFSVCRLREAFHRRLQERRVAKIEREASSIVQKEGSFHF